MNKLSRISKGAVEIMLRNLGKKAGISNVHPHRLRRTAATTALKRGMPIEQVQKMLGHESIDMHFSIVSNIFLSAKRMTDLIFSIPDL